MEKSPINVTRPFGPAIGFTNISNDLIEKINNFIDVATMTDYATELDHGKNLAGQVTQEIKLPSEIINDGLINFFGTLTKGYIKSILNKEISKFELLSAWVVRQFENEYNPPHLHKGHISGLGYLKLPQSFGDTIQRSKKNNTHGEINFMHGSEQFLSTGIKTEKPKVGDFYIFPSYLYHFVNPFYGDGERRSVSFNAVVDESIAKI